MCPILAAMLGYGLLLKEIWQPRHAKHKASPCPHAGFAGADYDLQDALVESTNKASSKAERHGQSFYDYELAGPVSSTALCNTLDRHNLTHLNVKTLHCMAVHDWGWRQPQKIYRILQVQCASPRLHSVLLTAPLVCAVPDTHCTTGHPISCDSH